MPTGQSANPLAGQNELPMLSKFSINICVDPTTTASLVVVGALLELEAYTPPTSPGDGSWTPMLAKLSATTADSLLLGPITGGASNGVAPVLTPGVGYLAQVTILGYANIAIDSTTTVGSSLIQSTSTVGTAHPGAAVTNQTIGTALQAVTFVSGLTLCQAFICKT